MSLFDSTSVNVSMSAISEDSISNHFKIGSVKKQQLLRSIDEERDKNSFYRDLYHFHELKGTPIPRSPRINGHEIDLHKLYSIACSRGGWNKINYRNEWEDLVPEFDLPAKCVNASVALKQIYMRYLDRYEKVHFLGEDDSRNVDENDDENRHKKWSNKNFNEVPLKYNYNQHNVTEAMRTQYKLSTNLYKASEFERLLLSLMSPLPNEQDFAINVCTLMANESKHTLKIEFCPKLVDALMGHAGVFAQYSMREIFEQEYYSGIRKHSLQSFWNDCLHDKPDILELSYEDYFQSSENEKHDENAPSRPPIRLRSNGNEVFEDGLNTRANELDDLSLDFLNLRRGLGTQDYVGQRVHQITSICRNLSFFDENVPALVQNRTFIRYLIMCSNIRWGNLHQMALDMLGNVANELELWDPTSDDLTRCLLATISNGLQSQDRGVIISCLEILYKLCQKSSNEDYLHRCLNKKIYRQICMYLSLNDIMLLLYTLECLFALSSLGEKSCLAIVQINGVIDTLMSLVSVEAQSYGPDGCILMRVVETVPTHMAPIAHHHHHQQQQHTQQQQQPQQNFTALQNTPQTHQTPMHHQQLTLPVQSQTILQPTTTSVPFASPEQPKQTVIQVPQQQQQAQPPQPSQMASVQQQPNQNQTAPVQQTPPIQVQQPIQIQNIQQQQQPSTPIRMQTMASPMISTPHPTTSISTSQPIISSSTTLLSSNVIYSEQQTPTTSPSSTPNTAAKQAQQENEQFCLAWLRATFEPAAIYSSRIEQQDLYKMYLTACSKIGRAGTVSIYHFPRCVRSVFGATVGPNQVKIKQNNIDSTAHCYEGMRIRAQPLAIVHKGTILQAAVTTTPIQPAEKKENQSTVIKTSIPHGVVQQPVPILQQVLNSQNVGENVVLVAQNRPNIIQVNSSVNASSLTSTSPSSSSLIKSLLANKVNVDGTPALNAATITVSVASPTITTANVNVHQQVAQRQHLQKQKEAAAAAAAAAVTNAIEAKTIVIKQTIGGKSTVIEKKIDDVNKVNWDPVPPLAPLSHSTVRQTSIITAPIASPIVSPPKMDEDSNSTSHSASSSICGTNPTTPSCADDTDNSFAGFEGLLIPGHDSRDENALNKQSPVVSNNKMLADLLERKSTDPPFNMPTDGKRKIESVSSSASENGEPSSKRPVETVVIDDDDDDYEIPKSATNQKQTTTSNAANLYAKLAASLLEDEDMELEDTSSNATATVPLQPVVQAPTIVEPPKPMITVPMQRQIIVSPNNPPQMILAPSTANSSLGQATATIKTESGYQTVPVILQHNASNAMANIQIQKPMGNIGQQIIQPVMQQSQTQYVLATNQQGQTYILAQQQQPSVNQYVLTQSSQQQGGAPTKTIIILQQPNVSSQNSSHPILGTVNSPGTPQKMIMTTQQGQQMIVTQVPRPMQHHVIVSQHSIVSSSNVIQASPMITTTSPMVNSVLSSSAQPHIVSHMQLQQTQGQIALPPMNQKPMVSQSSQIVASVMAPTISTAVNQSHDKKPNPEKKVFVTGSGSIEITEVQQSSSSNPIQQSPASNAHITPQTQPNVAPTPVSVASNQMGASLPTPTAVAPAPIIVQKVDEDAEWPFICDWRGCPRKKFRSSNELYIHTCAVHCPDSIDPSAEIYCQWGPGPNLCDNLPRKRFSLMTHIQDRHCSIDALKAAVQRRLAAAPQPNQPSQPVTIIKNPQIAAAENGTASPAPSTSSSGSINAGSSAAMQAIKRHTMEMINPKELMDENEGPVTKSIRLTAALILRNLVNYTTTAKRCLRYYEPHLSGIALSNVESSRTIAQVLYEMNETRPY